MTAIDPAYTAKTYSEAERVKNQIQKNLQNGVAVSFEHQGSVPLNTHIKIHSDLDILAILTNFFSLESPQVPAYPYKADFPLRKYNNCAWIRQIAIFESSQMA
jgi:hypothetical protein